MSTDEEFATLSDELFRRIGRNLLNFQRIERMLKFLVANGRLKGPIKELAKMREAHTKVVHQSTMGILAGRFVSDFLEDAGDSNEDPELPVTEAWVSFKVTLSQDAAFSAELRDNLKALVDERNDLVHHLHDRWDGKTVESTRAALIHLEDQRERLRPVFERLQEIVRTTAEGIREHAEFFSSPEASRSLELIWLCHSPVVRLLGECSNNAAHTDGWLALATAGHILRRDLPDDVASLKERYGFSTLKRLILATDMFEVRDEPTQGGGFHTVYRRKPEAVDSVG